MIPDPHEQTVRIPAKWSNGQWQLFDGGALPELKDGSIVDLVFPARCLKHLDDIELWTQEVTLPFLPAGTPVYARVNAQKVPPPLLERLAKNVRSNRATTGYVQVTLHKDLTITVVPGKKGKLNDCQCSIPALDETAESLNEAYKKIAITFEPNRRSNSGNIFLLAFIEQDGHLKSLDKLRDEVLIAGVPTSQPPNSPPPQSTNPQLPGMP